MDRIEAKIKSFRPTFIDNVPFGYEVLTDKGMKYVPKQLFPNGIEPGMVISYEEHKAGDTYTTKTGEKKQFKKDGISNIHVVKTLSTAKEEHLILFKHSLVKVEEEA